SHEVVDRRIQFGQEIGYDLALPSILTITCGHSTPPFQMPERIFDSLPHFISILVVISLIFSLFLGRNHRPHLSLIGFWKNCLAIITPIGQ
ncbi:MAG: hypothetical protein QF569_28345, partial [Candidatus Poribacteria bacterium]|nr:hypothetical protein [Candidatus Poribacteria bacterium]